MEITGLIITILFALIYFSILIANNNVLESNDDKLNENTSSLFALVTSYTLYTIFLFQLITKYLDNKVLVLLIIAYLSGLIFLLITFIPITYLVNKNSALTLKILKPFNLLAKALFLPEK